uniref:RBR-type E3 ubiquitin transferase n=1 Tax=Coccidioides posadasii RMSCC 3488 TaxID=454284 RepID=A0A0J6FEE0_COCPO|nr:IBR domain-containing protein [Coccidioides posadasii RMSCC 3488]
MITNIPGPGMSPVRRLSYHSHHSEIGDPLSEWLGPNALKNLDIADEPPADWMEHPCPRELLDFPEATAPDLLQILNLSVEADLYRNHEYEKEIAFPTLPENLLSPVEPPAKRSQDLPRSDRVSEVSRSSTALSRRSFTFSRDGASTKSAFGKFSVKAPKEVRAISVSMKGKYSVQECASCLEGITDKNLIRLECQHRYCLKCFSTLVTTAMHNETQFPPRCCLLEIPIKVILHNLNNANRELFKEKTHEFSIPEQDRWYCHSATCGKWIPPKKVKSGATVQKCPFCKIEICGMCRGPVHVSLLDCPGDIGLEATLEEADLCGWRRCPQCRAMVELISGCRHMICKCRAQFCYTCGARWRTCQCTEVDQRRREEELQDRRFERNAAAELEARELADALAEIERLEQREAEEIVRREEARRRAEEEEAREREAQRMMAIAESTRNMRLALDRINKLQQTVLIKRHEADASSLQEELQDQVKQFELRRQRLESALRSNVEKRTKMLASSHDAEIKELTSKHEEEEDEMFISLSRHLKNKPNREEREKSCMDKLKALQDEKIAATYKAHEEARNELELKTEIENKSLEAALVKEQSSFPSIDRRVDLAKRITIDRHWFRVVVRKRSDLLELHRTRLVRGESSPEEPYLKRSHFTRSSKPPSPPPTYPLPPPPSVVSACTPSRPGSSNTPMFPPPPDSPNPQYSLFSRHPEVPHTPSPLTTAPVTISTFEAKQEQASLKELILKSSRNRRLNQSAFSSLSS